MLGDGTQSDPWRITTYGHLRDLANYVNTGNGTLTAGVYYRLMNDVAYPQTVANPVIPIGNNITNTSATRFQGNFNGDGKKVSNITINRVAASYIGLFGYVSSAQIYDLGVEVQRITGDQYVGGLIGKADNSFISNCYVIGTANAIITGNAVVGGLVGATYNSAIRDCYALCDVKGSVVGGLVGINDGQSIASSTQTSYAGGNVTATGNQAGGFVGANNHIIMDCYAIGNVTGAASSVGGFVGYNRGGSITYCYAAGDVAATGNFIGGLVGENHNGGAILRNSVAANNTVTGGIFTTGINRVSGTNTGALYNNYAFDIMVIIPDGGNTGTLVPMATLMSFPFYNTPMGWYLTRWSIDIAPNPNERWGICNGQSLPFLQWQQGQWSACIPINCAFNAYGTGTQNDPYLIYYPCQLKDLADFVNQGNGLQTAGKYFKLMDDLDLIDYSYGEGWDPIGYYYACNDHSFKFWGNFDGNCKKITNLVINRNNNTHEHIGLFGYVYHATIHDLGIEGCNITSDCTTGSLVGGTDFTTIKNCYAIGSVTTTGLPVQCPTGGLVGSLYNSTLENSYSTCNVVGAGYVIGGLVGQQSETNDISCIINNCYATGTVIGYIFVGGVVGFGSDHIRSCVAANSSISKSGSGNNYENRIVGYDSGSVLSNNYAYEGMLVNGLTVTGTHTNVNGEDKPMSTLQSFNFYNTSGNWYSGITWDIAIGSHPTKIWGICDGETLPLLQCQGINCNKKSPPTEDPKEDYTKQNGKSAFSIFPNPTSGELQVMIVGQAYNDIIGVEIFDVLGRAVYSQPNNGTHITLDISGYSNGVYFVRIMTADGVEVQKIVKK